MNSKMEKVVFGNVVRSKSFLVGKLIYHMNQIQVIARCMLYMLPHIDHEQVKEQLTERRIA
jgi:translation elongation factor EF-1alpha